jgi:hypothetical protein
MRIHFHNVLLFLLKTTIAAKLLTDEGLVAWKSASTTVVIPPPLVVPPSQYCRLVNFNAVYVFSNQIFGGWNRWTME